MSQRVLLYAACAAAAAGFGCAGRSPVETCRAPCEPPTVCRAGRCTRVACTSPVHCFGDERCVDGLCSRGPDPCESVACAPGQACVKGQCFPVDCSDADCGGSSVCDRVCRERSCVGVICAADQACAKGQCLPTACGGTPCPAGQVCDGVCNEPACVDVECPGDYDCVGGRCYPLACRSGSGGGVCTVATRAPIVGTGASPDPVAMPPASAAGAGHLAATDWSAFNAKVSSVTAGSSAVVVGGTSNAPTIDVDPAVVQRRVAGSCLQGSAIRAVAQDGSATCSAASVTASAPLSGDGSPASPLLIPQATAATSGHLSSSDWIAFDAKVSSVTSASPALSVGGTATSPVLSLNSAAVQSRVTGACAGGSAIASIAGDGTVACGPAASSASSGYLTSIDWSTFNGKVSMVTSLSSGLTVGGTATDPTLTLNATAVQTRVSGTCGPGSAVSAIAQDGTVTCTSGSGGAYGFAETGEVLVTAASAGAPQTLINVTGAGILYAQTAQAEISSGTADVWVRVTLDSVVLNGGFTRIIDSAGLLPPVTLHAKGPFISVDPRTQPDVLDGSTRGTPFTWVSGSVHTTINGNIYKAATTPLFFKSTLRIEIYRTATGAVTVRTRAFYGTP